MSTRACYRFFDEPPTDGSPPWYECVTVYKHSDGYPEGASEAIYAALDYAWPLPRFEADDFAAAFVAANKGLRTRYRDQLDALLRKAKLTPKQKDEVVRLRESLENYSPGGRYAEYGGGGVRLVPFEGLRAHTRFASDTEYLYDIRFPRATVLGGKPPKGGWQLEVTAYTTCERDGKWWIKEFFKGPLKKLADAKPPEGPYPPQGEPDYVSRGETIPDDEPGKPGTLDLIREAIGGLYRIKGRLEKANA